MSPLRAIAALTALLGLCSMSLALGAATVAGQSGGLPGGAIVGALGPGAGAGDGPATPSVAAEVAVSWALARVGTPYRWGGESPGGFDCSGLTRAAYAAAGIALPRVAQDQYDAGPPVPPRAGLWPGDLVFFGSGPGAVEHVGMVVGDGAMVDAPHSGATVRVEPMWSTGYVGATRPGS